jgi:hypothetical protein
LSFTFISIMRFYLKNRYNTSAHFSDKEFVGIPLWKTAGPLKLLTL